MQEKSDVIGLTTEIVSSYLSNNAMQAGDIPGLIKSVHKALVETETPQQESTATSVEPVVSIKASVKPDHLVCLVCGAKFKSLKRHLRTAHDMTPEEYRDRYNLPASYPMVAAMYAEERSKLAKTIGLGRKRAG